MSLPLLHPRYFIVNKAEAELHEYMLDLERRHELTIGEIFKILSSRMAEMARSLIREERHPGQPYKKGDEA